MQCRGRINIFNDHQSQGKNSERKAINQRNRNIDVTVTLFMLRLLA